MGGMGEQQNLKKSALLDRPPKLKADLLRNNLET